MLKSSKKGLYSSLLKKLERTREGGLRKGSPEDQNRTGRGRFLRKGERTSSRKGQKSAESRALRLLAAVGVTGVPVAHDL